MKHRYKFRDRKSAEEAYSRADGQATILSHAVNALLAGEPADWIGAAGPYVLRIYRTACPSGGFCILTFQPQGQATHSSVSYWEEEYAFQYARPILWNDPEAMALRGLFLDAHVAITLARTKASA